MSATIQKQSGDLVQITGSVNMGQEGILQEKTSKDRNKNLRTGRLFWPHSPLLKCLRKREEFEENPQSEHPQDITKLTTLQLSELAKQKGATSARTKVDFLIIIKAKHPDKDLERLKGKVLFDRVSELHISRLR